MSRAAVAAVAAVWLAAPAAAQATRAPGPPLAVRTVVAPADSLRPPDRWIARDKALHAAGGLLITLSAQYVLTDKLDLPNGRALPVAAGSAMALGLLKEAADARRPVGAHFSWRDLAADAVGVALAALVTAL